MFPIKNLKTQHVSTAIVVFYTFLVGIILLYLDTSPKVILLVSITAGFTGFLISNYLIERFINRKIKLIYKFIYQTKASKREEFFNKAVLPKQSLEEVGEEVLLWADQRKVEMEMLEKNEAFRKEFLQNLAHEFKTPAFAIQGYLETLLEGAADDPNLSKKFIGNAMRNTERLISLISDLDEITKLESGLVKLYSQNFVIQELIAEVYEMLSRKANEKNISCIIKKGCDQPISAYADKEKIRQVLANLVDNAIKYGNQDGKIEASIYLTDEKNILVEITDNGIGISESHLGRVFERFYRTDYGRSRNIGGSGLGLAICKHIIEAHEQIIHARSTPGIGTTFGFTLAAKTESIKTTKEIKIQ
jgi:two-component system, OmpR family, phosphate regulon sensor histidine kinase PhoR